MADVIDTESFRRPLRPRSWAVIVVLLVAGLILGGVLDHHNSQHQNSPSVMGSLTPTQYAAAQEVMNGWTAQQGTRVSTAFAVMQPTNNPALTSCPLVVTLGGRFAQPSMPRPYPRVSPPGTVLIARADLSGRTCEWTLGRHGASVKPPGAADLAPVH